jgi:3'5'-cyclic nucleotide phosphodiesterase
MSFHFELLSKFKNLVTSNLVQGDLLLENEEDLLLLLRMVLHSADIANPTKPWENAFQWASLLLEEFFNQGTVYDIRWKRVGV